MDIVRDQQWYLFGRQVEYLQGYIQQFQKRLAATKRGHRHLFAEIALSEAKYSLRKLDNRCFGDSRQDYATVDRERRRIFDDVEKLNDYYYKD
jgi:hypothetical protein